MKPEDWESGDIPWVVEIAGSEHAYLDLLTELANGPLADRKFRICNDAARARARANPLLAGRIEEDRLLPIRSKRRSSPQCCCSSGMSR
jgi:hypothetical protein